MVNIPARRRDQIGNSDDLSVHILDIHRGLWFLRLVDDSTAENQSRFIGRIDGDRCGDRQLNLGANGQRKVQVYRELEHLLDIDLTSRDLNIGGIDGW